MRLHHLRLEAFGPFADRVDLDLDTVGAAGLFLVQGPTGAGKTSILDAICFALFAGVPGVRPSGASLRSDHAAPDAVPRVRLELTAGGRRLRVTRSPEFPRPKLRGTGTVKEPAKVVLEERVAGTWVARSTRADEVGEIVRDVLGMGLEQFSRVVVLPQGEFAAFLRSRPEERRQLLEHLFDVSSFAALEAWLADARRAQDRLVAGLRADLDTDLARLADVLARVPSDELDKPADESRGDGTTRWADPADRPRFEKVPLAGLPAALTAVAEGLAAREVQTLTEHDAASAAELAATGEREQGVARAAARRRGEAARDGLAALEAEAPRAAADAELLDRARAAAALRGELAAEGRARASLEESECARATALAALDGTVAGADLADPAEVLARLADGEAGLVALGRTATELGETLSAVAGAKAALARVEAAAAADPARLASLTVAVDAAAAAVEATADAVRALTLAGEQARALARLGGLREHLDATTRALDAAVAAEASARDAAVAAREALVSLREARVAGMAGELAGSLADGCPCPVCGSLAHPTPAPTEQAVPQVALEEATALADAAQAALAAASEHRAGLEARAAALLTGLDGEERDAAALEEALTGARAEEERLREQAATLPALRAALEQAARALEAARTDAGGRDREVASASARLTSLQAQADRHAESLRAGLVGHDEVCPGRCAGTLPVGGPGPDEDRDGTDGQGSPADLVEVTRQVAMALATHRRLSRLVDRLGEATTAVERGRAEHAAATAALTGAATAAGFPAVADVTAALLPDVELAALERTVRDRAARAAAHHATLQDPEVVAALAADPVDVAALTAAADVARARMLLARDRWSALRAARAEFDELAGRVAAHAEALGPADDRLRSLADLADLVAGTGQGNALRMRLSSFVLAARLERVVQLANERLAVIGEGRYRLLHDDSPASHGRRSGLGLLVHDLWTGQRRDTATLSGGESFMASLALALGLAEAVREESGGRELQTLFVDEGFGTLDEGSLEQVMAVLDSLREGGRAVGVVSHVSDLRSRISHQVVVTKTTYGSSVRVLTGSATDAA